MPGDRAARIPSLDGWRAISIGLVLLGHFSAATAFPWNADLWGRIFQADLGVRVFFIISGLLITTLLLADGEPRGRVPARGRMVTFKMAHTAA